MILGNLLILDLFQSARISGQTTSQKTTVALYVNGIQTSADDVSTVDLPNLRNRWSSYATSKGITQQVVFDYSYNNHTTAKGDFLQSIDQALNLPAGTLVNDTQNYGLLMTWAYADEVIKNRARKANFVDPDLTKLDAKIKCYLLGGTQIANATTCTNPGTKWSGTKVLLFGYSQGNFYTNFAYEDMLNDKTFQAQLGVTLPNPNVLEVVNLADPANYSADSRYKYLTMCDDPIRFVTRSLPTNFQTSSLYCSWPVQFITDLTLATGALSSELLTFSSLPGLASAANNTLNYVGTLAATPHFLSTYLADGSTQLQTSMQLLADSLPDPGCGSDINCYMKDNFNSSDYGVNWYIAVNAFGFGTVNQNSGILQLNSLNVTGWPGATLSIRSRRVFTGSFTMSLNYNSSGTTGTNSIGLLNAQDNSAQLVPWALAADPNGTGWHTLTFTKTDTLLTMYVNGTTYTATTTPTSGYYLDFDLQGDNTLQVQNLSVLVGATPPATMTLTPTSNSLSVVQGNYATINLTAQGQNISGSATVSGQCVSNAGVTQSCPIGFLYNYPTTVAIPTTGTVPLAVTFDTRNLPAVGVYYYDWTLTLNSVTSNKVRTVVTVTAPTTTTPTMTLTPASNSLSVVQGNSSYVDLLLTSKNGLTGNPNSQLYCVGSCPTNFLYNYPQGTPTNLPADGSITMRMTFYTAATATPGTYNFTYQDTLNGVVVSASIAVTVTASTPTMTLTPASTTLNVVQGNPITANLTLTSVNGMTGNPSIALYCVGTCPTGYGYSYTSGSTRTLTANGTLPITATFTPSTSSTLGVSNFKYTVVLNGVTKEATIAVNVSAAAPQFGTVVVMTNGTVPSVACTLNGVSLTGPGTFTNQPVGTKTLSCTPPSLFTITSITPSPSQTLSANGTVTFTVNLLAPTPTLSYLTVNTQPKVNTNISVSLFGSNFVPGVQAYICNYPGGVCNATTTVLTNSGQLSLPYVQWNTAATIYLRVVNPGGLFSGFLTMVVIN
jgi:hypothetical protein